jgi:hypothetical protein
MTILDTTCVTFGRVSSLGDSHSNDQLLNVFSPSSIDYEIIDLSFVRSPAYVSYFEALDKEGGFFYERWGDAPVRSIAASMMLNRSEVWNIDYAGYVSCRVSTVRSLCRKSPY